MTIKPIGKASSGKQLTAAVAQSTGHQISLTDIYGNPLIRFELEDPHDRVVEVASQPPFSADVTFVAALTERGLVYSFDFRPVKTMRDSTEMPEGLFSEKYKLALLQHQYMPYHRTYKSPERNETYSSDHRKVDLHSLIPSQMEKDRTFLKMVVTYVRPDKPYYVILDNKDTFWLLNKHLKLHGIVQSNRPVTSLQARSTAVFFTQGSNVVFINPEAAELGAVTCKAPRGAELVQAAVDAESLMYTYGLSFEQMEVYVWRSSLNQGKPPSECLFGFKFTI